MQHLIYPGDDASECTTTLCGNLGQIFKLKQKYRHMKVLLCIGGWEFSSHLATAILHPANRENFANSVITLIKDYGFDGVEIDWEYAETINQARQFVELLKVVREKIDNFSEEMNLEEGQIELTVAGPAGPVQYSRMRLGQMDDYVTFWNLMGYDFSGPWVSKVAYQSNLYHGELSTDSAVKAYLAAGIPSTKIVVGMPAYGRLFLGTSGVGDHFTSTGPGTRFGGIYDYKYLNSEKDRVDPYQICAFHYNHTLSTFMSFDNPLVTEAKAMYVVENNLGGGMFWEVSTDAHINSPRSLIRKFTDTIGFKRFKNCNLLDYPESKFTNVRNAAFFADE